MEQARLARASRKLGLRAGAQFKKLVPQQEKENLGLHTRRRLCGDRIEGEYVGAIQGYCVNTILDTLTFSSRVWVLRMEKQCKLQIIDDLKDENPVWLDSEQISKYRSHVAICLSVRKEQA